MRTLLILLCLVLGKPAVATEKPTFAPSDLLVPPDLSPSLTKEEVAIKFDDWKTTITKISKGWPEDLLKTMHEARKSLAPQIPKAHKITLYSLVPVDGPNLWNAYKQKAEEYKKLPKFHGYPILGSTTISGDEANRWCVFMREQIVSGAYLACDFEPRHGIKFHTENGEVDILMCFKCDQLALIPREKQELEHNAVLSDAVRGQLDQVFDKLRIKRDEPKASP